VKGILNVPSTLKISMILIFGLLIKNYDLNVFSYISHVLDILFTTRSSRKVRTRTALPSIPWRLSASFSRPWTDLKSTNPMSSAARRFTMQLLEELRSPVFFCFRLENLSYLTIRLWNYFTSWFILAWDWIDICINCAVLQRWKIARNMKHKSNGWGSLVQIC